MQHNAKEECKDIKIVQKISVALHKTKERIDTEAHYSKEFLDDLAKEIQSEDQPERVRKEIDSILAEGVDENVDSVMTKALDNLYNVEGQKKWSSTLQNFMNMQKGKLIFR
jgi:hypothetical protein